MEKQISEILKNGEVSKLIDLLIGQYVPENYSINLDLSSLSILMETIKNYRGTVLIISHDEYFINEIGVTNSIQL